MSSAFCFVDGAARLISNEVAVRRAMLMVVVSPELENSELDLGIIVELLPASGNGLEPLHLTLRGGKGIFNASGFRKRLIGWSILNSHCKQLPCIVFRH